MIQGEPVLNIRTAQDINIYNNQFIVNTASTAPQMHQNFQAQKDAHIVVAGYAQQQLHSSGLDESEATPNVEQRRKVRLKVDPMPQRHSQNRSNSQTRSK